MTKLPAGAQAPHEIITDLTDKRLFGETFAGVFNNRSGVVKHLIEKGLGGAELATVENDLSPINRTYEKLLSDSREARDEHNWWYVNLYMNGFKRIFGYRAANRQSELRTVYKEHDMDPIPVPVYVGELPAHLDSSETRDYFQCLLDYRYGEHGVLAGPPPIALALYEDIAVSLRPSARTLIQAETEVWHIESRAHLRGPASAKIAA